MFGEQRFTYVRILTVILTPYCTYHCTIVDSSVVPFLTCASTVSTDPRWLWLRLWLARLRLRLGLQAPSSQARLQARLQARRLPLASFSIRCTSSSDNGRFHGSNGMMKCWMPSATVHVSTYLRSLYISLSIIDNMQGKTGRRPTTRQPQAGGSCERKQNNRPTDRQERMSSSTLPIDRSTDRFTESWKTRNVGEYVDFHKKR